MPKIFLMKVSFLKVIYGYNKNVITVIIIMRANFPENNLGL